MCFAGWRLLQSVFDADRHGSNSYGLMRRASLGGSALFYLALAAATARITLRSAGQRRSVGTRVDGMGHDAAIRTLSDRADCAWICCGFDRPSGEGLSGPVPRRARCDGRRSGQWRSPSDRRNHDARARIPDIWLLSGYCRLRWQFAGGWRSGRYYAQCNITLMAACCLASPRSASWLLAFLRSSRRRRAGLPR